MRIAMVVHSYYPSDPRIRKEARALTEDGHEVCVVCLRGDGQGPSERLAGVDVRRLRVSRNRSSGKLGYLAEYATFFTLAGAALAKRDPDGPFDVVHVSNVPDELVFCAAVPRARGSRVVLDLHDPMPELFVDKYGIRDGGGVHRLLGWMQLRSCAFADHVIVSSEPFRDQLVTRGLSPDNVSVVLNGPEEASRRGVPFTMVYHGSLFERYGLETVLRGIASAAEDVPGAELLVFGSDVDPAYVREMERLAVDLGIGDRVAFSGRIPAAAVRLTLRSADLGLVPARRSAHIDLVYPTKLFDYLNAGLPVLVARTPPIERRFGDALSYYEPDDAESFASALRRSASTANARRRLAHRGVLHEDLGWDAVSAQVVSAVTGETRTV